MTYTIEEQYDYLIIENYFNTVFYLLKNIRGFLNEIGHLDI